MNILIVDNGLPFNLETPYKIPLGGSEITALLLAKGLSEFNNQVILLTTSTDQQVNGNLKKDHILSINNYFNSCDVILLNRCVVPELIKTNHKKIFYLSHDAYDQELIKWLGNKDASSYFNQLICVSNWQKQTFIDYFNFPKNKMKILGNCIDPDLYNGHAVRDPNKLIFASIPYKGLEILPELFNEIKIRSKNDKVHLDIFSSMSLYHNPKGDEQYKDVFIKLDKIKDIQLHAPVSMSQLAFILKSASIYLAPSLYHETFGRVFIEAMASGCIPVAMDNGANKEIIKDYGYIVEFPNIKNINAFNRYVDVICEILEQKNSKTFEIRSKMEQYSIDTWNYKKVSKDLLNILTN